MTIANLSKLLIIMTVVVLSTGCNTMTSSLDSVKYGKLYTMQEVLSEAINNCTDKAARTRALEWAVIGYNDLENSRQFMERTSEKYKSTRAMMRTLAQVSSRRIDNSEKLCEKLDVIAKANQNYLASIDMMSDEMIVLAAVRY